MLKKVYVETTVVSYLTARPSRQEQMRLDQEATKQWWAGCRDYCDLYASLLVVQEAGDGDPKAAAERLAVLRDFTILRPDDRMRKLARRFVKEGAIPPTEREDALHVAIAAASGMDYLLAWNLRHIKNLAQQAEIERICRKSGVEPPVIHTPRELEEAHRAQPHP